MGGSETESADGDEGRPAGTQVTCRAPLHKLCVGSLLLPPPNLCPGIVGCRQPTLTRSRAQGLGG
eukprot:COSAG01_NODE_2824_length_7006_cov_2.795714_1_plen_64_part_10